MLSHLKLAVFFCFFLTQVAAAAGTGPAFAEFDRRAKAGDHLNVVFFGASLTWGANATDPLLTSYRGQFADRLREKYPDAHFRFWDGAIGGTGSQLGIFRLDRDVLRHQPDLVFLDFSANDDINSDDREKNSSYEALVRRIITQGNCPLVQVIFPFRWDIEVGNFDKMKRRDAHRAISAAYHTGLGDAIELGQKRVKAGETTLDKLWPLDGVHPGNAGYELFCDAAWNGFLESVESQAVCKAPEKMLFDPSYMTSGRNHIAAFEKLPTGWQTTTPNVLSAYFDMMMSRWLDDEVVARSPLPDPKSKKPQEPSETPERLKYDFRGSMVMLFGESTPKSVKYRAYIDGKLVEHNEGTVAKPNVLTEFDAGVFGRRAGGNVHHWQVIATGLDPAMPHTLEIEPIFDAPGQELRLESICTAGPPANE